MTAIGVLQLIGATLLPVVVASVLYVLEKKTKYGKLNYWWRQTITGILFGVVAILATQFDIAVVDSTGTKIAGMNVRNASPVVAGLIFGGTAGIISGGIGGVYRYVATYWGAGAFSQLACSIGCILAGLFAAGCRKFMFNNKKTPLIYGFAIGITTEVLHMLLVFVTNYSDIYQAYKVVAACAIPMILCTGVSVTLSILAVSIIGKEKWSKSNHIRKIAQSFQLWLVVCVIVAFAVTSVFTNSLQTRIADANAESVLKFAIEDIQTEIDEIKSQRENTQEEIAKIAKHRHVGQEGCVIVCDSNMTIVSVNNSNSSASGKVLSSQTAINLSATKQDTRFKSMVFNTKSYCIYRFYNDYYIIATIPETEVTISRNMSVSILMFMEILVFSALFIHIYFLIKRTVVDNIHKVNSSLGKITSGDLNERINVRVNEEFASLSDDINATVETLKHYIAEAENRIDRELEFARQIQHSSLPSVFPPYPDRKEFDIFATMDSAKEVGGDFYDFYMTDSGLIFLVADVSGKSIPGAMFMMRAKTLLKNLAESGKSIDEVFTAANRALCENNEADMFVTAWMGLLDLKTGKLQYVNAGHNPPVIRRKDGSAEFLRTKPNFILAGMDGTKYKMNETTLLPNEEIFLYTDGVTEATDDNGKLYGEDRLLVAITNGAKEPQKLCKAVREDIDKFVGNAEQFDDITTLCVRVNYVESENSITVVPDKNSISQISDFLQRKSDEWGLALADGNRVQIITDEIYSNIASYSSAKRAMITIENKKEKIILTFTDDGKPYNPLTAKEPDVTLSAEEREIGGLGIFMVKKMAAEVSYNHIDERNQLNVVILKKSRENQG